MLKKCSHESSFCYLTLFHHWQNPKGSQSKAEGSNHFDTILGLSPARRELTLTLIEAYAWCTYLVSHFSTIKWVPFERIFIRLTFFKKFI